MMIRPDEENHESAIGADPDYDVETSNDEEFDYEQQ